MYTNNFLNDNETLSCVKFKTLAFINKVIEDFLFIR